MFDVIVIGGGAAGLTAAISIKQSRPCFNVLILEKLSRVGKKLATTGNGRCNITNKNIELSRYHGADTNFAGYALEKYNSKYCQDFFEFLGVPFIFEEDKAYPQSLQAASVVDALRFECDRLGVKTETEAEVTDIQSKSGVFSVISKEKQYVAKTVLVATGLLSGGEKLGCDGKMANAIAKKGITLKPTFPGIVQLKTDTTYTKSLKGIKVNAKACLFVNNKAVREETGEVLFCDYGLSGPPILQLSRTANANAKEKCVISLDLVKSTGFPDLQKQLLARKEALSYRNNDEFFTGLLNKRLGQTVLKSCGIALSESVKSLSETDIEKICKTLKGFKFNVIGSTGFVNSQVTAGGLATNDFDSKTFACKKLKGLFAAGEILDIDGDCGGFNLQWAWSSAFAAANGIIEYLEEK